MKLCLPIQDSEKQYLRTMVLVFFKDKGKYTNTYKSDVYFPFSFIHYCVRMRVYVGWVLPPLCM